MRSRSIALALAGAILATSATAAVPRDNASGEARLARIVEGRTAGAPVDCINLRGITSTEVIDRTAIIYRSGGRLYVNRPDAGLSSLRRNDILVTRTSLSQLCSVDVVRLLDPTVRFQTGFVGLGRFVPYSRRAAD